MKGMKAKRRYKGLFYLSLFMSLCFGLFLMMMNGQKAHAAWSGYGSGTEDDPYLIYTKEEFLKFRDIVEGANGETKNARACATLKRNINLGGSETNQWDPIGTDLWNGYDGTFDGRNHSISGLYIHIASETDLPSESKYRHYGLFTTFGANTTVKNLIVNGEITIENIGDNYCSAGGIVGTVYGAYSKVENCLCNVNINAAGCKVTAGGIVGAWSYFGGTIQNCINTGNISARNNAGGIAGSTSGSPRDEEDMCNINHCYNTGDVTVGVASSSQYAGGIAGEPSHAFIDSCYNDGDITGYCAGGIIGYGEYCNSKTIVSHVKDCYNTGTIFGVKPGGIASMTCTELLNCHNCGTISSEEADKNNRGLIASELYYYENGDTESAGWADKCYPKGGTMDGTVAKTTYPAGTGNVSKVAEANFTNPNSFPHFDFDNVWEIKENADYPTLRNMPVITERADEPYPHEHVFTYTASGATITATCTGEDADHEACPITEELKLTIVAPTELEADDTEKVATIQSGYNTTAFPNPTIKYYKGTEEVTSCKTAGTYTAKVTFGTATAETSFTITAADTPSSDTPSSETPGSSDTPSQSGTPSSSETKDYTDTPAGDSAKKIVDTKNGVTVETTGETIIPKTVVLRVVLKAQVVESEHKEITNILNNQKISKVYDIKLIQTTDGKEKEIQPSEIKAGTNLVIHLAVPAGIDTNEARIVHVHGGVATFVENVKVENNEFVFEVANLSEFAIVIQTHGLAGWAIALIIIGAVILAIAIAYILLFFVFNKWITVNGKNIRVIKCGKKDDKVRVITMLFAIEYVEEAEVFDKKENSVAA